MNRRLAAGQELTRLYDNLGGGFKNSIASNIKQELVQKSYRWPDCPLPASPSTSRKCCDKQTVSSGWAAGTGLRSAVSGALMHARNLE
jgi:hypothetical protein